jgi:hypothetical protein
MDTNRILKELWEEAMSCLSEIPTTHNNFTTQEEREDERTLVKMTVENKYRLDMENERHDQDYYDATDEAVLKLNMVEGFLKNCIYEQTREATVDILTHCRMSIVRFEPTRVRDFLDSVEFVLSLMKGLRSHMIDVLRYAQTKITGNEYIANQRYTSFADFKRDILIQFQN